MNVKRYFLLMYFCMAMQLLYVGNIITAEEVITSKSVTKKPKTIIKNVTNIIPRVTQPLSIACIQNGVAVLQEKSWILWNETSQRAISLKIHPTQGGLETLFNFTVNKQGTKIAILGHNFLSVYNAITAKQEWKQNINNFDFAPLLFDPQDETKVLFYKDAIIFMCSQSKTIPIRTLIEPFLEANKLFAHHPLKKEIIYGGSCTEYYCSNYQKQIDTTYAVNSYFSDHYFVIGQEYSYDGSHVALIARSGDETYIPFILPENKSDTFIVSKHPCVSVLFHPNNEIMFLLSANNRVECWDFAAKKRMHTFCFSGLNPIKEESYLQKRLALSLYGWYLNIAFQDRCAKIRIPFEVFYSQKMIKKLITLLLLENHGDVPLPKDVIHVVGKKLLDVSCLPDVLRVQ